MESTWHTCHGSTSGIDGLVAHTTFPSSTGVGAGDTTHRKPSALGLVPRKVSTVLSFDQERYHFWRLCLKKPRTPRFRILRGLDGNSVLPCLTHPVLNLHLLCCRSPLSLPSPRPPSPGKLALCPWSPVSLTHSLVSHGILPGRAPAATLCQSGLGHSHQNHCPCPSVCVSPWAWAQAGPVSPPGPPAPHGRRVGRCAKHAVEGVREEPGS